MPLARAAAVAALVLINLQGTARAVADADTPVAKVITLLSDLVKEVEAEGKREATTYDKFSCFCKSSTESKGAEITKGADKIDGLSATIEEKSTDKKDKQQTMMERKGKGETMSKELDEETERCRKEEASYDSRSLELTKAITGIGDALKSLTNSKKGAASAALLFLHGSVRDSLELAQTLDLIQEPAAKATVASFLQQGVDPADAGYKFQSNGILAILKMLKTQYGDNKGVLDSEWTKTDAACKQTKTTLGKDLKNNKDAITALDEKMEVLGGEIAKAKEDLVSEQTALSDAQGFLQDLTTRCEARAKDWDQRTETRKEEHQVLSKALAILGSKVKDADTAANKRALLLSASAPVVVKATAPVAAKASTAAVTTDDATRADSRAIATELTALQGSGADDVKLSAGMPDDSTDVAAWLHSGAASFLQVNELSLDKRRQQVVLKILQQEGKRLNSAMLSSLALRMGSSGSPFDKVKGLIQNLIERLLKESAGEATKKGFCDEQLGKTELARDYSLAESKKLNAQIAELEVNKEALDLEDGELKTRISDLEKEHDEAKKLREEEHDSNVEGIAKAKEGLEAVTGALVMLKEFYKKAGAASLLQASPVDAPEAPEGDYKGKQGAAQSILGLLEVIQSDFERTLKDTEAAEKTGASDFEQEKQNVEASVAGHTTKRSLDQQDSKTMHITIKRKTADMKAAMDSVDGHLRTLDDLKPTCIDTGMSYKERVQKREDEMAALQKALCTLDTEDVESECQP